MNTKFLVLLSLYCWEFKHWVFLIKKMSRLVNKGRASKASWAPPSFVSRLRIDLHWPRQKRNDSVILHFTASKKVVLLFSIPPLVWDLSENMATYTKLSLYYTIQLCKGGWSIPLWTQYGMAMNQSTNRIVCRYSLSILWLMSNFRLLEGKVMLLIN